MMMTMMMMMMTSQWQTEWENANFDASHLGNNLSDFVGRSKLLV